VCFVHKLLCVENIFNTLINVLKYEIQAYEWKNIILYIYMSNVFSMRNICVQKYELMNEQTSQNFHY